METVMNWIASNALVMLAIAALLCGVALMSVLMGRTARHRKEAESLQD